MKNREEILKELKEIAPNLASLDKTRPDDVPVSYFNAFSADVLKKIRAIELAEELSSVAPELAKMEKINALEAPPASYFKSAPSAILKRIKASEKAAGASVPGWMTSLNVYIEHVSGFIFKPKYSVAFAGFATVIILAVMLVMKVEEQCTDIDCRMAQLSTEELNSYFNDHSDEFTSSVLDDGGDESAPESNGKNSFLDVSDEELNNAILD